MEQYTIGQIAKALGISTQILRHYESLGLLDAERDEKNQYRTYKIKDTKLLFQTTIYRAMGFSLKKINRMLKEEEISQVEESLKERMDQIEQEIEALQGVREEIGEYYKSLVFADSRQGRCWIDPEDFEFYGVMKRGSGYSIVRGEDEALLETQKKVPYVRQGFIVPLEVLRNFGKEFDYKYGVVMKKEGICRHCDEAGMEEYLVKLSGPIAKMILGLKPMDFFSREWFLPFLEAIENMGYEPAGDCYGVARYVTFREDEDNLFEFLIPVKPMSGKVSS